MDNRMICLVLLLVSFTKPSKTDMMGYYDIARDTIIRAEEGLMTGGRIILNDLEQKVEDILQKHKKAEILRGFEDPSTYAPGMHFFQAKDIIDESEVFKFIRKMPKGAVLHGHNTAMVSADWVIRNATYRPNLMKCHKKNGALKFTFRHIEGCENYVLIADERKNSKDASKYDAELMKLINLYTPHPEVDYPHINSIWEKFQKIFDIQKELLSYLPVYRDYHWQLLEEMYEDGVMYIELRTSFRGYYDDERQYSLEESVQEMRNIVQGFKATHPGFLGVKAIYSTNRNVDPETVEERIEIFRNIYKKYPDFVMGFDLVGQEDLGAPLHDFVEEFQTLPQGAQFFFHAGETNWYGSSTDQNLFDAILLNTTRIGHGYALFKHPFLWSQVKNRGIAIEVSPLSNQILHLVWDLRNHPGSFFVSENLPLVICNDDPGYWNAKGISYDMYYAFMSFAPNDAGLATLKQMVMNSLRYSALTNAERFEAQMQFQRQWDVFLSSMLKDQETNNDGRNSASKHLSTISLLLLTAWASAILA